jgi:hypothetical protein
MRYHLLAIVLATLAFTLWGFAWYATVFDDIWQSLIARSEGELIEMANMRGGFQNFFTYWISFVQAMGLFILLKWVKAKTFTQYIGLSLIVSTLIVLPALGNATLFAGTPTALLILDFGHFSLGYGGIAFVFFLIRPRMSSAS